MTKTEAAEFLSLSENASAEDVRGRFQELYSDYHIRLTNAPTATLKRVYQRNLEEVRLACETFFPGMVFATPQDLPSAEPMPGMAETSTPRSFTASQAVPSVPNEPKTVSGHSNRGFNIIVVCAAIVGSMAVLFAVLWFRSTSEREALDNFLQADSNDQVSYLSQHPHLAPQLHKTLAMLTNGKFSVCNDSSTPIDITWVIATYRGPDGAFHTFNSKNYPTMDSEGNPVWVKWHVIGNGGRENLNLVKGSELVWDGSVITYAIGVHFDDQEYVRGGSWSTVQDGCVHVRY